MEVHNQLQEQFTISDLETLKVIADPLRLQILRTLKQPRTVKDIAAKLHRSPTQLYYHVNQLEKHGLIQVAATHVVSGIIEKHFQAAARNYRVDQELLSDKEFVGEGLEALVMTILEDTKDEIRKSIQAGRIELADNAAETAQIIRSNLYLRKEQMIELGTALENLSEEYEAKSHANRDEPDSEACGFTVVFYPVAMDEEDEDSDE